MYHSEPNWVSWVYIVVFRFRTGGLSLSLLAYIHHRTVSWEEVFEPPLPAVIVSIGLQTYRRNTAPVNELSGSRPVVRMGPITDSVRSWEQSIAGQRTDGPVDFERQCAVNH
jgi:hypothetical protein